MPNKFNKVLWELGRKIEDEIRPYLNDFLECEFERKDNIYDVLDFHDEDKKTIVEVKGRTCDSKAWKETIITCNKITEGLMMMETGWTIYYFFVFTDKTMYFKLDPKNCDFKMKYTGTRHIPHFLIPVDYLTEFDPN